MQTVRVWVCVCVCKINRRFYGPIIYLFIMGINSFIIIFIANARPTITTRIPNVMQYVVQFLPGFQNIPQKVIKIEKKNSKFHCTSNIFGTI